MVTCWSTNVSPCYFTDINFCLKNCRTPRPNVRLFCTRVCFVFNDSCEILLPHFKWKSNNFHCKTLGSWIHASTILLKIILTSSSCNPMFRTQIVGPHRLHGGRIDDWQCASTQFWISPPTKDWWFTMLTHPEMSTGIISPPPPAWGERKSLFTFDHPLGTVPNLNSLIVWLWNKMRRALILNMSFCGIKHLKHTGSSGTFGSLRLHVSFLFFLFRLYNPGAEVPSVADLREALTLIPSRFVSENDIPIYLIVVKYLKFVTQDGVLKISTWEDHFISFWTQLHVL